MAGERQGTGSPSEPPESNRHRQDLEFGFLAQELRQPWETNTFPCTAWARIRPGPSLAPQPGPFLLPSANLGLLGAELGPAALLSRPRGVREALSTQPRGRARRHVVTRWPWVWRRRKCPDLQGVFMSLSQTGNCWETKSRWAELTLHRSAVLQLVLYIGEKGPLRGPRKCTGGRLREAAGRRGSLRVCTKGEMERRGPL